MNDTSEQTAIYNRLADPAGGNLIVNACPGSGKTTTIVRAQTHIPKKGWVSPATVFLAFNKHTCETLKPRVPATTQVSTFHALGFQALKASGIVPRNVKVDGNKCSRYVFDALGSGGDARGAIRLVSLLKSFVGEPTTEDALKFVGHHDIQFDEQQKAVTAALRALDKSNNDLSVIDFDDMLYLAVRHSVSFMQYDYVFVDEAQDTNDIQLEIIERLNKATTRLCFVGDPHQAIYGFRGANADSMDRIAARFSCQSLPLSVSWRCSVAAVRRAQEILNQPIC